MIGFLAANWIWIVLVVGMLAMHRMHGGHGGGCGGAGHRSGHAPSRSEADQPPSAGTNPDRPTGGDGSTPTRRGDKVGASTHRGC